MTRRRRLRERALERLSTRATGPGSEGHRRRAGAGVMVLFSVFLFVAW
ncbi:hypothetical protein [Sphaerobacter thermophilus]|nr:hypothetical protein [Sphaerobacter thermophilus]